MAFLTSRIGTPLPIDRFRALGRLRERANPPTSQRLTRWQPPVAPCFCMRRRMPVDLRRLHPYLNAPPSNSDARLTLHLPKRYFGVAPSIRAPRAALPRIEHILPNPRSKKPYAEFASSEAERTPSTRFTCSAAISSSFGGSPRVRPTMRSVSRLRPLPGHKRRERWNACGAPRRGPDIGTRRQAP